MMLDTDGDPEFMTSLARGLAVLRCFADQAQPMTIAQASRLTGLSRPAVRRCLHTLVRLGYAVQHERTYALQPKVLALGYAYLSTSPLAVRAQPMLDGLRDKLRESCSLGVAEGDEVVYVARAESSRIMSVSLRVGSRLPLYCTSMGRVALAFRPRAEQEAYLRRAALVQRTPRTETDPAALLAIFVKVAEQGFALIDQELELGLRSIAVPVVGRDGFLAALNVGVPATRITPSTMRTEYLPSLRQLARDLGFTLKGPGGA